MKTVSIHAIHVSKWLRMAGKQQYCLMSSSGNYETADGLLTEPLFRISQFCWCIKLSFLTQNSESKCLCLSMCEWKMRKKSILTNTMLDSTLKIVGQSQSQGWEKPRISCLVVCKSLCITYCIITVRKYSFRWRKGNAANHIIIIFMYSILSYYSVYYMRVQYVIHLWHYFSFLFSNMFFHI